MLTHGSRGSDVVELQTRLNLRPPTKLLPLVPDGIFGRKTVERVKEFQRHNALAADGIVRPNTWKKLEASTPVPGMPPPPTLGIARAKILQHAKAQVGMIDYQKRKGPQREPHGWQHLGTIFEKGAGLKLSDAELQQTWRPRNKDWCGIFCVYCYQLAGKQVTWNLHGGGPQGAIKKTWPWDLGTRKAFEAAIQPGDIAAVAGKSHHFIVVSTNSAADGMKSVDGNQEFGRIKGLAIRKLSQVVAFYSPQ
jgi:putative peptidoglycan binding protein